MFNYKISIAYDGTHYSGWQIQPNAKSIQEMIQRAISIFLHEEVKLIGSGRTDSGTHAKGQVAHFKSEQRINSRRFVRAMNGILPFDIRVTDMEQVDLDFHARYSAKGKIYHYHICLDPVQSPFDRLYSWHYCRNVDVEKLKEAAQCFLGTHDFTTFANVGSHMRNPVKTIRRIDCIETEKGVRLEFEGDGFLYKMVRNIVGTMVEVSEGKREATEIAGLFEAKDRRKACKAAPAHGLFLVKVLY